MRRVLGAVAAMACVAMLSSCSLLPFGPHNDGNQQADAEMQRIADAVNNHDAAALKKLFSTPAREKAPELDSGLKYFLSVFPSGLKSLGEPDGAPGGTGDDDFGKQTTVLFADYKVSANGKYYDLYFADYTVNQVDDPNNVGLYALGVTLYDARPGTNPTAASQAFFNWTSQFGIKHHSATGEPGVYIPQK